MLAEAASNNEGDSMSTSSMRRLLTQQLGAEAFSAAHARLRNVAEEEDDDSLVRDIQQILGPGRLEQKLHEELCLINNRAVTRARLRKMKERMGMTHLLAEDETKQT